MRYMSQMAAGPLARLAAPLLLLLLLLLACSLALAETDMVRNRHFTFPVSLVQLFSDEDTRWTISVLPALSEESLDSSAEAWHELGELTVERDTTAATVILHMPSTSASEAAQKTRREKQPVGQRGAAQAATMMYAIYCVESATQAGAAAGGAMPVPRNTLHEDDDGEEEGEVNSQRRARARAIKGQCFFLSDATAGADVFVSYRVKSVGEDETTASRRRRRRVHEQHQSGAKPPQADKAQLSIDETSLLPQEIRVMYKSAGALLREAAEGASEEEGVVLGRAHVLAAQLPQGGAPHAASAAAARTKRGGTENDATTLTWRFALDEKKRAHGEEEEDENDVVGWVMPRGLRLRGVRVSPEQRQRERRLGSRRSRQLLKATSFVRRWVVPLLWALVLYGLAWLWSAYATRKSKVQRAAAATKPKMQ